MGLLHGGTELRGDSLITQCMAGSGKMGHGQSIRGAKDTSNKL